VGNGKTKKRSDLFFFFFGDQWREGLGFKAFQTWL
jgi:hypothetical protein